MLWEQVDKPILIVICVFAILILAEPNHSKLWPEWNLCLPCRSSWIQRSTKLRTWGYSQYPWRRFKKYCVQKLTLEEFILDLQKCKIRKFFISVAVNNISMSIWNLKFWKATLLKFSAREKYDYRMRFLL